MLSRFEAEGRPPNCGSCRFWTMSAVGHRAVNPHRKDEKLSSIILASFPFGRSWAAFAGCAPLAKCRH
eukprot:7601506-Pyramimonas_sp.AAC.1